jgi:hypothetical protein
MSTARVSTNGTATPDAEYRRTLEAKLAQSQAALDAANGEIDRLAAKRDSLKEEAGHLRALLGISAEAPPAVAHERDASIADLVVQLLKEESKPMHYREIAAALEARHAIAANGRDPANTLLARYFDDPRLYRPSRGTYFLREGNVVRNVGVRSKSVRSKKKRQSVRVRSRSNGE